jgi:hypothetical protein
MPRCYAGKACSGSPWALAIAGVRTPACCASGACMCHSNWLPTWRAAAQVTELADARVEHAVEAQVLAHLGHALQQLRAAQQRQERAVDALARAVDEAPARRRAGLRSSIRFGRQRQAFAPGWAKPWRRVGGLDSGMDVSGWGEEMGARAPQPGGAGQQAGAPACSASARPRAARDIAAAARTATGPAIWPSAKAAVMRPTSRAASPRARGPASPARRPA